MKRLLLLVPLVLAGCVTASYKDGNGEEFSITTLFKSVEGLNVSRDAEGFDLRANSTATQDPVGVMKDAVDLVREIEGG